jgi:hypothetical protein
MVAGDTESCAEDDPSPDRGMEMLEFAAVLTIERVPLAEPEALGEKMTFTLMLPPPATVAGRTGMELRVNPLPLTPILETVGVLVPSAGLLTTKETVFFPPTATLPKSMALADTVKAVELMDALGAGARAHPDSRAVASSTQPDK